MASRANIPPELAMRIYMGARDVQARQAFSRLLGFSRTLGLPVYLRTHIRGLSNGRPDREMLTMLRARLVGYTYLRGPRTPLDDFNLYIRIKYPGNAFRMRNPYENNRRIRQRTRR